MNISKGHFVEIIKKGLSLDMVYLLDISRSGEDIGDFTEPRVKALVSTLRRKRLIADHLITQNGRDLLDSLKSDSQEIKLKKVVKKDDDWEKFLKNYPPNNKFTWKGRSFDGDRGIRKNTKDGKSLFIDIINDGEITCDDLIGSVVAEALNKMEASFKAGVNKMTYFTNTESWLRQKQYYNWLEEGRGLDSNDLKQYYEAFDRKKKPTSNRKGAINI